MAKKEKNQKVQSENIENACNDEMNCAESTENTNESESQSADGSKEEDAENIETEASGGKKKKKDAKDTLIEELQDRNKRQMAEFDNFRKRTEKEKSAMYEIGARDIIEKILPIVDNFERAFKSTTEEEKATPLAEGMEKVYRQFMKTLEDAGVKPIEALGKEFNPDLHNAVMHVDDESEGEGIIVEEFEKGYTYRESVVRHSMVKVAN